METIWAILKNSKTSEKTAKATFGNFWIFLCYFLFQFLVTLGDIAIISTGSKDTSHRYLALAMELLSRKRLKLAMAQLLRYCVYVKTTKICSTSMATIHACLTIGSIGLSSLLLNRYINSLF